MPPSEIIRGGRSASRSSANRPHGPVRQTRSKSASVESKSSSVESKSSVTQTRSSKYRKSASVNDSFAIKSPSDPPILHHPHGTVRQTRSKSASVGRKSRKSATVKNTFSVKSPSDPPILRRQSSRLSGEQGILQRSYDLEPLHRLRSAVHTIIIRTVITSTQVRHLVCKQTSWTGQSIRTARKATQNHLTMDP